MCDTKIVEIEGNEEIRCETGDSSWTKRGKTVAMEFIQKIALSGDSFQIIQW